MKNFKLLTLFLFFTLVGLSSCGKDDDGNGEDNNKAPILKVHVMYDANGNDANPDAGAKVYVFYDFDFKNPNGYVYQVGGKYVKDDSTYTPDQIVTVGADGYAVIEQKFKNRKITVVIESKYYQGQYDETFYPIFNEYIILARTFRAE